MVASNGDSCLIRVFFLWAYIADDFGVRHFMSTVMQYVIIDNGPVRNHDVLVPTAGVDWELAGVISEQFVEW